MESKQRMEQMPPTQPADDIRSFLPNLPENMEFQPDSVHDIVYQATLRMVATERHHARQAMLHDADDEAPRNHPKAWNKTWAADPASRQNIEEEYSSDLTLAREQLAIANDVTQQTTRLAAETPTDARGEVQQNLGRHIWRHILFPGKSKIAPDDRSLKNRLRGSGLAVIAPTGSGKTYIQAEALQAMGIGQPSMAEPTRNRRALVCVSDQAMVNQYLGRVGDDTFRTVLGKEVGVGAVWQHDKNADEDVTVVVTSTLPKLIEDGKIDPEQYDVTVVDEGHRIFGKRTRETLAKLGTRLMLFTATPTYNERRSLRQITETVSEGNIKEFVRRGILSPVRLLTYRPEAGNELEAAAHLASKAIKEGRKVLVYCKASSAADEEKDTQYVCRRINEQTQLETGITPAATVGKVNKSHTNNDHLVQFQEKTIRALVTVGMLREGYNDPDVDTVILIGPRLSLVDIEQRLGRCMRKGEREALAIELIPQRAQDDLRRYYSLWNVFDLEQVQQGALIKERRRIVPLEGVDLDLSSPEHQAGQLSPHPTVASPEVTQAEQAQASILADYALPAHLGSFYEQNLVRSITLSPEANAAEDIKEKSVSLSSLAQKYGISESWFAYRLDKAQIPYSSIYNFDASTGQRTYERWYGEQAIAEYVQTNPFPEGGDRVSLGSLVSILGATKKCVSGIIADLGIVGKPGVELNKRQTITYTMDDVKRIEAEVTRIPVATENDVLLADLQREFKELGWPRSFPASYAADKRNDITVYNRRSVNSTGVGASQDYVSAADAQRIKHLYENGAIATDAHISITEIARLAGVSISSVLNHLTEEDRMDAEWLRSSPSGRSAEYLQRERGLAVVDRLEPKKLPPDLVPMPMVVARLDAKKTVIEAYIHRHRDEIAPRSLNLGLSKGFVSCISWEALEQLEDAYATKGGVQPIDFRQIKANETNYMHAVQRWHIDQVHLEPLHDWMPVETAQALLGCTESALPILLTLVKGKDHINDLLQERDGHWNINITIVERMQRCPIKEAPHGLVSHTRLLAEFDKKSLVFPSKQGFRANDRVLGRNAKGTIDVYYKAIIAQAMLKRAAAQSA